MKHFLIIATFVSSIFFAVGCEQTTDQQAMAAQACLDRAVTVADANACLASISATSTDSRILRVRCGLKFIANGINQAALITAFANLKTQTAGADPVMAMATQIQITNTGGQAQDVVNTCTASGSTALIMMANAAMLGGLANDVGSCAGNAATCATNAATLPAATVGNIAINVMNSYCAGGASNSVCNSLNKAVTTGGCAANNAACIGAWLQANCLNQTNC